MNVKIIYDQDENEFIAFVPGIVGITGFGETEEQSILSFLYQCKNETIFNQKIINTLISKIENETQL